MADVDIVARKQDGFTLRNGYPAYYITVQREYDANTVSILDAVNEAIAELNAGPLADAQLEMDLSFDASVHIRRAISLVKNNLGIGLVLAIGVLYFLMRSRRATFLVTATVPLSLLVAFVALRMFDKTLNVISLAGLAFAVGLVMDAAIVTLENLVQGSRRPDLTLLLDLPVETGLARAAKRSEPDRFERQKLDFFQRVRDAYLQIARQQPARVKVVDASLELDRVQEQISDILTPYLARSG